MALIYKVYQRKNRLKGGEEYQMATQVNKGSIPIRDIAERLEKVTSLGRGDVMNVLTHLGEVVAEYVREGYSVKLHELGTFTPRVSSMSVPKGEEFRATHIKSLNMRYTPSTYIKEALRRVKFESQADVCKAPQNNGTSEAPSDGATDDGGSDL